MHIEFTTPRGTYELTDTHLRVANADVRAEYDWLIVGGLASNVRRGGTRPHEWNAIHLISAR